MINNTLTNSRGSMEFNYKVKNINKHCLGTHCLSAGGDSGLFYVSGPMDACFMSSRSR